MESGWLWQAAQSHQRQLIDEAARHRRRQEGSRRVAAASGLRSWTALRLRRLADWLEPSVQPQLRILRAVAHHELDVEQALWLLRPARPLTARR